MTWVRHARKADQSTARTFVLLPNLIILGLNQTKRGQMHTANRYACLRLVNWNRD